MGSDTPSIAARVAFVPTAGKLPGSSQVNAALQARIAAAQQLSDDLNDFKGKELPADLMAPLRDALITEDDERQAFFDQQLASAQDPGLQITLWRDRLNWLALKYRVARGAFGKNLVAEWNKDSAQIAEQAAEAWSALFQLYQAQAAAVAKPQNPDQATEDMLRQELIAVRWGWYSGANEQDVRDALDEITQRLMNTTTPALHLNAITRGGKTMYVLLPDELYGLNEKALPK
jgi:hypothetical protein